MEVLSSSVIDRMIDSMVRKKPQIVNEKINYKGCLLSQIYHIDPKDISIPENSTYGGSLPISDESGHTIGIRIEIVTDSDSTDDDNDDSDVDYEDIMFTQSQLDRIAENLKTLQDKYPKEKTLWICDYLAKYEKISCKEYIRLTHQEYAEVEKRFLAQCDAEGLIPDGSIYLSKDGFTRSKYFI